jgi:hypothetical protein
VQPSSLKGRLSASTKTFKKQVPDKFKQHTFANGAETYSVTKLVSQMLITLLLCCMKDTLQAGTASTVQKAQLRDTRLLGASYALLQLIKVSKPFYRIEEAGFIGLIAVRVEQAADSQLQ